MYDYDEKNVVLYLWVFDSQTYSCTKDEKMCGSIHQTAIDWYKKETEKNYKKNKRHIPGLVFFHIPTSEYAEEFKNVYIYYILLLFSLLLLFFFSFYLYLFFLYFF